MKKIAAVLASLLVVACASSPKPGTSQPTVSNANNVSAVPNTNAAPVTMAGNTPQISAAELELNKLAASIKQLDEQSDYFDYNKFAIKSEYLEVIQKEAAFLKDHKNDVVTLEGNADERGSREYNLSLGNKRALSVKKRLASLGVSPAQIKLVSYGKDKPRLNCHEEKCWHENRRVDFIHKLG